jgi:two-component system, OmpR family, response regulator
MRILLIEDEPDLRSGLCRSLRDEGYAVDEANDGELGLYKALNTDYDAIILDLMLPVVDGWSLLRQVRKSRATPVIILTARDETANRIRGLDAGADDYLVKPFDLEELLARLRAVIRRSNQLPSNVISWNGVTLNTASQTITSHGVPVELTAREFALLEYLALHRGEVVSRAKLHEHLFDENDDTLSNLLEVHISHIRKKLGADVITTRRGSGYGIGL